MSPDGGLTQFPSDELRDLTPAEDAVLNGVFANAIAPEGDIRAYRAEPTLVVCEQGLRPVRPQETAYERVDVISNARRVFSVKGGRVAPAPEEAVRIGAWETFAERALLRQACAPFGALEAIRQATAAGIPLQVLQPGDGSVLKGLPHSAATVASVQHDLDAGYVVILPERPDGCGGRHRLVAGEPGDRRDAGHHHRRVRGLDGRIRLDAELVLHLGFHGVQQLPQRGRVEACCLLEASAWGGHGCGYLMGFRVIVYYW